VQRAQATDIRKTDKESLILKAIRSIGSVSPPSFQIPPSQYSVTFELSKRQTRRMFQQSVAVVCVTEPKLDARLTEK